MSSRPTPTAPFEVAPPGEIEALARIHAARNADMIRDEARALVRGMLEEALAPIHYIVRDLERRLDELERRPAPAAAPPPSAPQMPPPRAAAAPPPAAVPRASLELAPPPAVALLPVAAAPRTHYDPYGDLGVPFDGARRRRKVILFFALFLCVTFGALLASMIWSRVR